MFSEMRNKVEIKGSIVAIPKRIQSYSATKATSFHTRVYTWGFLFILLMVVPMSSAFAVPQCRDGVDNDGDAKIDALVEIPASSNNETFRFNSAWEIRVFVNSIPGLTKIPDRDPGSGAARYDTVTARAICNLKGFSRVNSMSHSRYHSCGDNTIGYWDENRNDFVIIGACNYNQFIHVLVCEGRLAACNDGKDNDSDGATDYPADGGCESLYDTSELMHDPDCTDPEDDREAPDFVPACNDGIDNDQDGLVDLHDPGCYSATDNNERDISGPQCDNGLDDDRDGKTDYPNDSDCSGPTDPKEGASVPQCKDGIDNDYDGVTDYPRDFSCSSDTDTDEGNPKAQCQDGVDNDHDGKVDLGDPGCSSTQDNDESSDQAAQCKDGRDNDGDGATDYPNDFSCSSATDNDERNPQAQCQDGIDNDHDGKTDLHDPGCSSKQDNSENSDNVSARCSDQQDNDHDGLVDMNDPGCYAPHDNSEKNISGPQCDNALDDDADGKVDYPADPDCSGPTDPEEGQPSNAKCADGIDNDHDGATDYPNDFSCSSPQDTDESNPKAQCQDGIDNDHDGKTDLSDPGCTSSQDNDESGEARPQCEDGVDNDHDGATDFPADFSCSSASDANETNPKAQCQDGIDNDSDGKVDGNDPGCSSTQDNDESTDSLRRQCSDGSDNDADGLTDAADPGCYGPQDNNERDISGPQCDNGLDDDSDGYRDYPDDAGCTGPTDSSESGGGGIPQCRDGIDNDGDNKIDALVEVPASNNNASFRFNSAWEIRNFVNSIPGLTKIPDRDPGSGAPRYESVTALAICNLKGFARVGSMAAGSYHSCGDNTIGYWDPNRSDFVIIHACSSNRFINVLVCEGRFGACNDGQDNDSDGKIDFPEDSGCASILDNSEIPHDPGCISPDDDDERNGTSGARQCTDGQDNDRDGLIDLNDPGCYSPFDNNERNISGPQCDNGLDDDGDGYFDYPNDSNCTGPLDNSECGACSRSAAGSANCCSKSSSGPGAPTNLEASDGTSSAHVKITWDSVPGAQFYQVYRSEHPEQIGEAIGAPVAQNSVLDRTAVPGVNYYYAATASNSEGTSWFCNTNWGYRLDLRAESDSDGDGVSDAQEELDGTDPQDRGSFGLHLKSPAYSSYNTFLEKWNFLELAASGEKAVNVVVTVYLPDGTELNVTPVTIEAKTQVDVDINALVAHGCELTHLCDNYSDLDNSGLVDLYGVVRIDFNVGEAGVSLTGRMSSYRQDKDGNFSFAFAKELRNPLRGKSQATGNTYDPQGLGYLVPNWVEIINLSDTTQAFTYRLFNQEGEEVYQKDLVIAPLAEVDMQAGHEITDADGNVVEGVYLAEVEALDGEAEYLMAVTRYSSNAQAGTEAQSYNFAFALEGRAGNGSPQYLPISNESGGCFTQTNWLELVNVRENEVEARLIFRGENGEALTAPITHTLVSKAQYHFNAGALLQQKSSGTVEIQSSDKGALIVQSLVYYHDCEMNRVQTAYSSQGRNAGAKAQVGSINSFLSMTNEVRVMSCVAEDSELAVELRTFDAVSNAQHSVLAVHGLGTSKLSTESSALAVEQDRYGALSLSASAQGNFVAEVLRVRPLADGRVDFAMPTAVQ